MFKNWRAIKDIPDRHFMWAIALLDLHTEFGQQIAAKFPEYFQQEQPTENGPIPLSVIIQRAEEAALGEGNGRQFPVIWDGAVDIPMIITFSLNSDNEDGNSVLPNEIAKQLKSGQKYIGQEVMWEGKKLVLLEESYSSSDYWIHFVPAELIIVDMRVDIDW